MKKKRKRKRYRSDSSNKEDPEKSEKTGKYNLEFDVIDMAKDDYVQGIANFENRKPLLCGTFIRASLEPMMTLLSNAMIMGGNCDWAIIIYDGSESDEKNICKNNILRGKVAHCKRSEITTSTNHTIETNIADIVEGVKTTPKTVLYHELLPFLPLYKKVFLLDEDISLVGFNPSLAMQIWDCSFYPPPLIVQPLIHENTQYFDFVGQYFWKNTGVVSSTVGIIEQQVPMFDSIFFEWFVKRVLLYTKPYAISLGVDWGHDRSWCNAAKMYGREVMHWPAYDTPCALLVGSKPVHHLNTKSISIKRKDPGKFRANGFEIVQKYAELFPSWVLWDIVVKTDPLSPRNKLRYKKVYSLNDTCLRIK